MNTAEIERVAKAIENAEVEYSMSLVRLVDGVSTYSLRYDDGETLEFASTDEVYAHVRQKRRLAQARAAIEAAASLQPTVDAEKVLSRLIYPVSTEVNQRGWELRETPMLEEAVRYLQASKATA